MSKEWLKKRKPFTKPLKGASHQIALRKKELRLLTPYDCQLEGDFYTFTSDKGIKYQYYFLDARNAYGIEFAEGSQVYDFGFQIADPSIKPKFDPRVKITLLAAINEFFMNNENSIIFTCSNTDGKEAYRKKVFNDWYMTYPEKDKYIKYDYKLDELDVGVYASYVALKGNPHTDYNKSLLDVFAGALVSGEIVK